MREIGFIGVGRMAAPMVRRFVERGTPAHLLDPVPAATEPFRGHPLATVHDAAPSLVRAAGVIVLSLPTPLALLEVSRQVAAAAEGDHEVTVVNTSTVGPAAAEEAAAVLTATGMSFVDAPVSGGPAGAREGSLTVMVSGPPDAVTRCAPVFDVIGAHVLEIGTRAGQAQAMKLANNVLALGALAATAEATALTSASGIPLDVAIDVLNVSSGRNSATEVKFPHHVLTGRFDFGYPVSGALKDVALFADLAGELGVATPLAHAVVECWRRAVDRGYGDHDCTHITTVYRRSAGGGDDLGR